MKSEEEIRERIKRAQRLKAAGKYNGSDLAYRVNLAREMILKWVIEIPIKKQPAHKFH